MKDTIVYWIPRDSNIAKTSNFMTEKDAIYLCYELSSNDAIVAYFDINERPSLRDWIININAGMELDY